MQEAYFNNPWTDYLYYTCCKHKALCCSCTVYAHMNGISQYHGMRLYYAWNTPVSCLEYACTTHGIRLYHAWNTLVRRMEYTWNMQVSCMKYPYFHAWNMHETCMKFRHQSMHVTCMELSGFGRMKCAETCMKHACFRRSILSRVGSSIIDLPL